MGIKYCKHCDKDVDILDKTHWYVYKRGKGQSFLCKTTYNNKLKKWRLSSNPLYKAQTYNLKANYRALKGAAKKRDLVVELTFEEYSSLRSLNNCNYCGDLIQETTGGAVDRVDSNLGYIKNNCVLCCKTCNIMKGTLNKESFLKHLTKILRKEHEK